MVAKITIYTKDNGFRVNISDQSYNRWGKPISRVHSVMSSNSDPELVKVVRELITHLMNAGKVKDEDAPQIKNASIYVGLDVDKAGLLFITTATDIKHELITKYREEVSLALDDVLQELVKFVDDRGEPCGVEASAIRFPRG